MTAVVPLAACSSSSDGASSDGQATLTFASWDAAEAATRDSTLALVKKFESEHPSIKVNLTPIPFSDFEQKVLLQVQSGSAPDVLQTSGNYTANFAAAGALEPLNTMAGGSYLSDVTPAVADVGKIDGNLYSVPWALQPVGFWYNKTLLAKAGLDPNSPPKTIDDLLAALRKLKSIPDVIPLGIDSTNRVFGLDVSWPWMRAFGAEPVKDGAANVNTPEMKSYLSFMRTLATEKLTEVNQKIGYFRPLAAQDKVAFIWDQPILEPTVKAAAPGAKSTFNSTWGVTTLPTAAGGQSYSVPQDHALAISKTAKNKEAAWTFVDWLTRNEAALDHVVADKGALPPTNKPPASVQAKVDADPALVAFRDQVVSTVIRPPWGPKYAKAYEPIMVGVQQMMTTTSSVDAIADQIQTSLSTALK
ncbi:extracellular solute-binding protein [Intrasporangium mesophilum]